ncbi:MAG: hypothetical protein H6641_15655 [Caldilineaceae bacterium]|nr:hypothetical protein [Caldilineaceae bacterium]
MTHEVLEKWQPTDDSEMGKIAARREAAQERVEYWRKKVEETSRLRVDATVAAQRITAESDPFEVARLQTALPVISKILELQEREHDSARGDVSGASASLRRHNDDLMQQIARLRVCAASELVRAQEILDADLLRICGHQNIPQPA